MLFRSRNETNYRNYLWNDVITSSVVEWSVKWREVFYEYHNKFIYMVAFFGKVSTFFYVKLCLMNRTFYFLCQRKHNYESNCLIGEKNGKQFSLILFCLRISHWFFFGPHYSQETCLLGVSLYLIHLNTNETIISLVVRT
jgi:hypothetical protein